MDNIFIEYPWKSVKYEGIYLIQIGEREKDLPRGSTDTTDSDGTTSGQVYRNRLTDRRNAV